MQVERRVVNQLALAYENGQISSGCKVIITANVPTTEEEKAKLQDSPVPIKIKVKAQGHTDFKLVDPAQQLKSS